VPPKDPDHSSSALEMMLSENPRDDVVPLKDPGHSSSALEMMLLESPRDDVVPLKDPEHSSSAFGIMLDHVVGANRVLVVWWSEFESLELVSGMRAVNDHGADTGLCDGCDEVSVRRCIR